MTNDNSKHELEVAPLGVCNACVSKMKGGGKSATRHDLGGGLLLFEIYCVEHEAGAMTFAGNGRPIQWTTVRPIDQLEFRSMVGRALTAQRAQRLRDAAH